MNGVLLGIVESNYALPIPFLLAAYLYFAVPANLKKRRLLTVATFTIVTFSLLFGLSYLTAGLGGSGLALAEGVAIVALDTAVTALAVYPFFLRENRI